MELYTYIYKKNKNKIQTNYINTHTEIERYTHYTDQSTKQIKLNTSSNQYRNQFSFVFTVNANKFS